MKVFLIAVFLTAAVVAFAAAALNLTPLYYIAGVITILSPLAAYGVDQLNTYLEGEETND